MDKNKIKIEKRTRRRNKIRSKIFGTVSAPRLSVFRSNIHIYAALIDDDSGKTLVSTSSVRSKEEQSSEISKSAKTKIVRAGEVGMEMAKKALEKKLKKVIFDRSGYVYTGRVKALAEGARKGGLNF